LFLQKRLTAKVGLLLASPMKLAGAFVPDAAGAPEKVLAAMGEDMDSLLAMLPEGFLTYLQASGLAQRGLTQGLDGDADLRKAVAAFELALQRPTVLCPPPTFRAVVLDSLLGCEFLLGMPRGKHPADLGMRGRAVAHLKERLGLPLSVRDPNTLDMYTAFALFAGDLGLAQTLLTDWQRLHPKDVRAVARQAQLHLQAGAFGPAIQAARRVLAEDSNAAAMKQLIQDASERLREEARRLPPRSP
jgi:hypothetical protein